MSFFVHLNGHLISKKEACISPFDHGFLYGDGIYETLRTIGGKVFDFTAHTKRLRKSAEIMDIPLPWTDAQLEIWTQQTIEKNGFSESRMRISVTRGENGFSFIGAKKPTLLIAATELMDYDKYKDGVALSAIKMSRLLPEAKSSSLLPLILAKQTAQRSGAFECLFLDENDCVTECSTSNVLYRNKNTIFIAPQKNVLSGTMQRIFLQKAKMHDYEIQEQKSSLKDVQNAEEVIITNSLFGALPVHDICGEKVQNCPGELYKKCSIDFAKDILVKYE